MPDVCGQSKTVYFWHHGVEEHQRKRCPQVPCLRESGQGNLAYSDNVLVKIGTPPTPVNPTPMPTPAPTPTPTSPTPGTPAPTPAPVAVTPAPAPAPRSQHHNKKKPVVVHHPKPVKHTVTHPKTVKHAAPHPKGAAGLLTSSKAHKAKPAVVIPVLHKKPSHA